MIQRYFRPGILPAALLLMLAGGAGVDGQQAPPPPPAPAQTPQFRAGVEVVAVDFMAVAADGQPVADLKAEEVSVRIDGRPRKIRTLEFIKFSEPGALGAPTATLPPPYGTNLVTDAGRDILLVLDNDSFRPGRERPLQDAVDRFLKYLTGRDRVAVIAMPYGGMLTDLTTDYARVREALSKVGGQAPSGESSQDAACRSRRTLQSLAGLLEQFTGRETPITLVFVSSGLMGPRRDAVATFAPGMCEIRTDEFQRVGRATAISRAQFFLLRPENIMDNRRPGGTEGIAGTGFTGSDNPLEGLESLAGVTGGQTLHLENTQEDGMMRIARQTSSYYLLSFEPEGADRNGENHQVDVRVSRAGVKVHSRPDVDIPRGQPAGTPAISVTPAEMLRQAKAHRELPMRVSAFVRRAPDGAGLSIIAAGEPFESGITLAAASLGLFDSSGTLKRNWSAAGTELKTGLVVTAFPAEPGRYRVRVAATDSLGRSGTADYEISAGLVPAGDLTVGTIVMGLSRSNSLIPKLEFGNEPAALAEVELYGGKEGQEVAVVFQVLKAPEGGVLLEVPAALAATAQPDRFRATATLAIGAIPPGDYLVRAFVWMKDGKPGMVTRTMRKQG